MSKVVVVGGGGYVGCVLVNELLAMGFSVRVVDRMFFGREAAAQFLDRVELVEADMRDFDESHVDDASEVINLGGLSNDPTATRDMAERILLLLERGVPPGNYHAANAGSCSWYVLAKSAIAIEGIEAEVSPRPTGDAAVQRPVFSVLLDTKSGSLGLPANRSWEAALRWYLENRPEPRTSGNRVP